MKEMKIPLLSIREITSYLDSTFQDNHVYRVVSVNCPEIQGLLFVDEYSKVKTVIYNNHDGNLVVVSYKKGETPSFDQEWEKLNDITYKLELSL